MLTDRIIASAIAVHKELGPGFLEAIYEEAFALELDRQQIPYQRQLPVRIRYCGVVVGMHRVDLIIDQKIVVELKAVKEIDDAHLATCLSYLKATRLRLGLIINFSEARTRIKRVMRAADLTTEKAIEYLDLSKTLVNSIQVSGKILEPHQRYSDIDLCKKDLHHGDHKKWVSVASPRTRHPRLSCVQDWAVDPFQDNNITMALDGVPLHIHGALREAVRMNDCQVAITKTKDEFACQFRGADEKFTIIDLQKARAIKGAESRERKIYYCDLFFEKEKNGRFCKTPYPWRDGSIWQTDLFDLRAEQVIRTYPTILDCENAL